MEEEDTSETFVKKRWTHYAITAGFQVEGKLLKHEIGPAKLPVVQVANHYLQDGKKFRQVQSIMQLPYHSLTNTDGRSVLIFTLNTDGEFTEYQRKHYVQIINSFNPHVAVAN